MGACLTRDGLTIQNIFNSLDTQLPPAKNSLQKTDQLHTLFICILYVLSIPGHRSVICAPSTHSRTHCTAATHPSANTILEPTNSPGSDIMVFISRSATWLAYRRRMYVPVICLVVNCCSFVYQIIWRIRRIFERYRYLTSPNAVREQLLKYHRVRYINSVSLRMF